MEGMDLEVKEAVFNLGVSTPVTSGVLHDITPGTKVGSLQDEWIHSNPEMRQAILALEAKMIGMSEAIQDEKELEQALPTIHHFAPAMYGREILLPKNSLVVGKLHRHSHLNIIAQGHVLVATEDGVEELEAPCIWTSKAGTKRVVYAYEDTTWVCVHPGTTDDIKELEHSVIAESYSALEA